MTEDEEIKPKPRRGRTKVDPVEKKQELEEKGEYVSPTREAEMKPGPLEEPPDHTDGELVDLQEEAERIFQDEILPRQVGP